MGKQRQRNRIKSRVDELPEEIRQLLDSRLSDVKITYREISEELLKKGYEISRSSIGRYAIRQGAALNRLKEAHDQTRILVQAVKENQEEDYTEAGIRILMDQLTKKMAIAQEEIDEMEPGEAGRLMVAISRSNIYKKKILADLTKGYKKAVDEVKAELQQELKSSPEIYEKLQELVSRVEAKVFQKLEVPNE